jgi:hypothetical protein
MYGQSNREQQQQWQEMCKCGHARIHHEVSYHTGVDGHGACFSCNCEKYTWVASLPDQQQEVTMKKSKSVLTDEEKKTKRRMCKCGHTGEYHGTSRAKGKYHGPCRQSGICSCKAFRWVNEPKAPKPEINVEPNVHAPTEGVPMVVFDDESARLAFSGRPRANVDRSMCSRCSGRDPECYICSRWE